MTPRPVPELWKYLYGDDSYHGWRLMSPWRLRVAAARELSDAEYRVLEALLDECRQPGQRVVHGPDRLREQTGKSDAECLALADALVRKGWMARETDGDGRTLYSFDGLAAKIGSLVPERPKQPPAKRQGGKREATDSANHTGGNDTGRNQTESNHTGGTTQPPSKTPASYRHDSRCDSHTRTRGDSASREDIRATIARFSPGKGRPDSGGERGR